MSYILDSLKKSENERGTSRKGVPGLSSNHSLPPRRKTPVWVWLILAITVSNGLFLVLFFQDRPNPSTSIQGLPVEKNTKPVPPLPDPGIAASTRAGGQTDKRSAPAPVEVPNAGDSASPQQPTGAPQSGHDIPSARETKLRLFSELPTDLIDRLTQLDITLHYYSRSDEKRMVRVNGRNLHQGDMLQPQVKVVEITPDGAILDVFGYRVWVEKP